MKLININVYLPEEAVDTWVTTRAEDLGDGLYKILLPENYDPEDMVMEFLPGSVVRAEEKMLYEGATSTPALVAVKNIKTKSGSV